MFVLPQSLTAWHSEAFSAILKTELEAIGPGHLPLAQGTSQGGYIGEDNITVTVNGFNELGDTLEGSVGVFFTEIVINCGCGSDPMPVNAYCELHVSIDKNTAVACFAVITE